MAPIPATSPASVESQLAVSETRLAVKARIDAEICETVGRTVHELCGHFENMVRVACALPIEPHEEPRDHESIALSAAERQERYRQHCQMIDRKLELSNAVVGGLQVLIDAARSLDLLHTEPRSKSGSATGDLDLTKLTTLNLTLVQAQKDAKAVQVTELPSVPVA